MEGLHFLRFVYFLKLISDSGVKDVPKPPQCSYSAVLQSSSVRTSFQKDGGLVDESPVKSKQKKDQGRDLGRCLFHPYLKIDQDQNSVPHILQAIVLGHHHRCLQEISILKSKPIDEITRLELQTIKEIQRFIIV